MIRSIARDDIRRRIHERIRQQVRGSAERPRLAVFRSVKHIYAQVIDDTQGQTLAAASSAEKSAAPNGGNVAGAKADRQTGRRACEGKRHQEGGVRPRRLSCITGA